MVSRPPVDDVLHRVGDRRHVHPSDLGPRDEPEGKALMTLVAQPAEVAIPEPPELVVHLRKPTDDADRGYVRRSWLESYKYAPVQHRLPWPIYKQTAGKTIDALLDRSDVELVAAYEPTGKIVGWCAWTPGRAVSTLHWIYVRQAIDDVPMRRRGVATALLEAAQLGRAVVYTFLGARRHRGLPSLDVPLVAWAKSRGVTATYAPVEEFLR
jgi:hypothetical protein